MGCINEINGHTKLTGLLGSPVAHSKSPLMHNEAFKELGLNYVYLCFDVPENNLKIAYEGLKKLNVAGFNCTMPDKTLICELVDELSPAASMIGAVNTVVNKDGRFISLKFLSIRTAFASSLPFLYCSRQVRSSSADNGLGNVFKKSRLSDTLMYLM